MTAVHVRAETSVSNVVLVNRFYSVRKDDWPAKFPFYCSYEWYKFPAEHRNAGK